MKKKVVFYCRDTVDNIGSMEYYRQDILALQKLGFEVVVCTRYRDIPLKYDLMYIWWWTYALAPVFVSRLLGRKCIVTGTYNFRHDGEVFKRDYFSRPFWERLLIYLATRLATINLFVSYNEFISVTSYFDLRNSLYYPHSVGDEYFNSPNRSARLKYNFLNIALSSVENLQRKGVWDILDAFRILRDGGLNVKLTLAGKLGDAFPLLLDRVIQLQLADVVDVVGEVSHERKLHLLSSSMIYLQPSYFEGFGVATAEAMASGCCVITCDVGEVRNVVGDTGLYVRPGNPVELAKTIRSLLADDACLADYSAKAKARVGEFFSFDKKLNNLKLILIKLSV